MSPAETKPESVLWLIEHPENGKRSPFYWGIEEGEQGWTADVRWAFKFDTEHEAELHASGVGIPDYQIRDHKWLDHKPTSNLDVAVSPAETKDQPGHTGGVLLELAQKCEALTEASAEIDARIWCAVFAPADAYVAQSRFNGAWCIYRGKDRSGEPRLWEDRTRTRIQPVTASLDAAMTLVPSNGRLLELGQWQDNGKADGWFAQVTQWERRGEHSWCDQGYAYGVPEIGATEKPKLAATGPLALCIVCLHARAASLRALSLARDAADRRVG